MWDITKETDMTKRLSKKTVILVAVVAALMSALVFVDNVYIPANCKPTGETSRNYKFGEMTHYDCGWFFNPRVPS